jgi:hypothetical protein
MEVKFRYRRYSGKSVETQAGHHDFLDYVEGELRVCGWKLSNKGHKVA